MNHRLWQKSDYQPRLGLSMIVVTFLVAVFVLLLRFVPQERDVVTIPKTGIVRGAGLCFVDQSVYVSLDGKKGKVVYVAGSTVIGEPIGARPGHSTGSNGLPVVAIAALENRVAAIKPATIEVPSLGYLAERLAENQSEIERRPTIFLPRLKWPYNLPCPDTIKVTGLIHATPTDTRFILKSVFPDNGAVRIWIKATFDRDLCVVVSREWTIPFEGLYIKNLKSHMVGGEGYDVVVR